MRARPYATRSALLALVLAIGPAIVVACDDTNERRTAAIYKVKGPSSAEADVGAEELRRILEKNPRDRYALYALAGYYEKRGQLAEARVLYQRIVDTSPNTDEGDHARTALAHLGASSSAHAAPPASVPLPALSATAILPGKGIAPIAVGSAASAIPSAVGPCELVSKSDDVDVCHLFSRGVEIASKDGKVVRIGVFRDGHEYVGHDGVHHAYRGFVGETPEGISLGMRVEDAVAKLGAPSGHREARAPLVAKDASFTVELLDFAKRGLTLEIDVTRGGKVVGAIQIPTVEGRPWPSSSGGKP